MRISEPSHLNNQMWHATLEPDDFPRWALIERHADTCDVARPVGYAGSSTSPYLAAAVTALPPERLRHFLMVSQVKRLDKRSSYTLGQMRQYTLGERFGFAPYDWASFKDDLLAWARGATNRIERDDDEAYLTAYAFLRVREAKQYGSPLGRLLYIVGSRKSDFLLSHRQLADWQQFIGGDEGAYVRDWSPTFGGPTSNEPRISFKGLSNLLLDFTDAERAELLAAGLATNAQKVERIVAARCELGLPGGVQQLLAEIEALPAHWLDSLVG